MFTKIHNWFINLFIKEKTYTAEQIRAINKFKSCFRIFFEGIYYEYTEPIYENYIRIINFGVTNLDFDFPKNKMIITITLERPGILIGKGGRTIDSLKEYLNNIFKDKFDEVKIDIKESKLWWHTQIK